ncbi:hypothetical protein E3T35_09950 [Cryobacterium sp. TMT1-2-2]|nr:hypothetical protein E3T35_09950 [Cryobacterium sp. TMT1-2-2]
MRQNLPKSALSEGRGSATCWLECGVRIEARPAYSGRLLECTTIQPFALQRDRTRRASERTASMPPTWQPSAWGKVLTSSGDWKLALHGDSITVTLGGVDIVTAVEDVEIVAVTRGLFWSRIELHVGEWVSRLYGIRSKDAAAFERAFAASLKVQQLRQRTVESDAAAHRATPRSLPKNSPQTKLRRSYGDLGALDQRNGEVA